MRITIAEDGIELNSPGEALLYGLLRLWGVPVEHSGRHYCPAFFLPEAELWAEVRGPEDDQGRYDAWRAAGCRLVVLGAMELEELRKTNGISLSASGRLAVMTLRAMERCQAYWPKQKR